MGNKSSHSQSESEESEPVRLPPSGRGRGRCEGAVAGGVAGEEGEEADVELQPPMTPISSVPGIEEAATSKTVSSKILL